MANQNCKQLPISGGEKVPKVWGYEEVVVNNELYCGKILHLKKGVRSSIHYHKAKDETFYCLEGVVRVSLRGKGSGWTTKVLAPGASVRIYSWVVHWFEGLTEEAKIVEFSTPHKDSDSYRIRESGWTNDWITLC